MSQILFHRIMFTMICGALIVAIFWGVYSIIGDVPEITHVRWHLGTGFVFLVIGMSSRLWDILFLPLIACAIVLEIPLARQREKEKNSPYLFAGLLICMIAGLEMCLTTGPCLPLMFGAVIGLFAPILSGFEFGRNCMKGFALGISLGVGLYTGGIVGATFMIGTGTVIALVTFFDNCLIRLWKMQKQFAFHR